MKKAEKIFAIIFAAVILITPILFLLQKQDPAQAARYSLLEFWHVESFEGGAYTRSGWLKARLKEFEKTYKGVIVHLNVLTEEQMRDALKRGDRFDIVSFSPGTGDLLLPYLTEYGGRMNIRDDLARYGVAAGQQVAVPYLLGGYLLATYAQNATKFKDDELINNIFNAELTKKLSKTTITLAGLDYGSAAFNLPVLSLIANNSPAGVLSESNKTQYEAYEGFLTGNISAIFLGTQRDLSRLQYRVKNGRLTEIKYSFLGGFSDLIQYVALGNDKPYAVKLIEYLTSDKTQHTIQGLEMFNTCGFPVHIDEHFRAMETVLNAPLKSVNAFISPESLTILRAASLTALSDARLREELINNLG